MIIVSQPQLKYAYIHAYMDGVYACVYIYIRANRAQLKIKRSKDLTFMLSLNETIDQLAVANSVHWHCRVLRREDGHVLFRG